LFSFAAQTKKCPTSIHLWILLGKFEEKQGIANAFAIYCRDVVFLSVLQIL